MDMDKTDIKYCSGCKKYYRATKVYFTANKGGLFGLYYICKYCKRAYEKARNGNPGKTYSRIKAEAKKRGIEFDISKEEYMTIFGKPCYYCAGGTKGYLDRVDNNKGYSIDNCESCCEICNKAKLTLSVTKFLNHCGRILQHQGLIDGYGLDCKACQDIS